jgi:hypothetical protein
MKKSIGIMILAAGLALGACAHQPTPREACLYDGFEPSS